jgi:hypothetical protein
MIYFFSAFFYISFFVLIKCSIELYFKFEENKIRRLIKRDNRRQVRRHFTFVPMAFNDGAVTFGFYYTISWFSYTKHMYTGGDGWVVESFYKHKENADLALYKTKLGVLFRG